ncbi:MAG: hypothetical protein U0R19_37985 [Bryobacteraceae bacterium]
MIVLDASVVVEMLLNCPLGEIGRERLAGGAAPLATSHIMDIEAVSALRGYDAACIALTVAGNAEFYASDRRLYRGHRARTRIFS